jgi:cysteine-rich repeat protein
MKRTISLIAGLFSGCTLLLTGAFAERNCGDGLLDKDQDEQCDDGNINPGDGCDSSCQIEPVCGDKTVNPPEACDDGNFISGDGCDANCTSTSCGNGVLTAGEACDDGNQSNGDGCSSACALEVCGDGVVQANEVCDDGNTNSGDGCTSDCSDVELCGDGVLDVGEQCDDGNAIENDGCDALCHAEAERFVLCDPSNLTGDGTIDNPFGTIQEAHNAALNGERIMILPNPDPCLENVTISKNITVLGFADSSSAGIRPMIDGGALPAFTVSKPGITVFLKNLSVTSTLSNGGAIQASNGAHVALLDIEATNITGGDEASAIACEGGSTLLLLDQSKVINSPGCGLRVRNGCGAIAANSLFQGNGAQGGRGSIRVDGGGSVLAMLSTFDNNNDNAAHGVIECNPGAIILRLDSIIATNNNGAALIDPDCTTSNSTTFGRNIAGTGNINSDPKLIDPAGGDFRLNSGSPGIDKANPNPPLFFDPIVLFGVDVLSHDFAGVPRGAARDMGMFEGPPCGNGVVNFGELCDDNNTINGDSCDNSCTPPSCGNNAVSSGEQCDDSNLDNNDGCSSTCALEICGDGVINNINESCEDGNFTDGDGCNATCGVERCGDGITNNINETCDDGNTNNNDGCSSTCIAEICGDSLVNNGTELCDDANGDNSDFCNDQCVLVPKNEVEPNEDGNTSTGGVGVNGNDFATTNPLARGIFTQSFAIDGAIAQRGDEDIFAVQNITNQPVSLRIETTSAIGVAGCAFDSVVSIRDENNNDLFTSDDEGIDKCSLIQGFTLNPNETVFVQVLAFADNSIFSYFLTVTFQ